MVTFDATVDIGAAGSNQDSTIFKMSGLGETLMQSKLNIPLSKTFLELILKCQSFL